jgi:hypothetical protein
VPPEWQDEEDYDPTALASLAQAIPPGASITERYSTVPRVVGFIGTERLATVYGTPRQRAIILAGRRQS